MEKVLPIKEFCQIKHEAFKSKNYSIERSQELNRIGIKWNGILYLPTKYQNG